MGENRAIRDLNIVTISWRGPSDPSSKESATKDYVFTAYLSKGFSLAYENRTNANSLSLDNGIMGIVFNLAGKAPAIDIPRWYSYAGSSPVSFTISCYLKLQSDPIEDIDKPLSTLASLTLPTRTVENVRQFLADKTVSMKDKPIIGSIHKILAGEEEFFGVNLEKEGFLNDAYLLNVPGPFRMLEGSGATITFGKNGTFVLDDVMINRVSMEFPSLLYEEGYPERVNINISVETARVATVNMMNSFLKKPTI